MSKEFDWEKYEDIEETPVKKFNWEDYADIEKPQSKAIDKLGGLLKKAGEVALSGAGGFAQGRVNNLISLANLFNASPAGNQFAYSGSELAEMPGGIDIPQVNAREYLPEGGVNTAAFGLMDLLGGIQGANKFGNQLKEFNPLFKGAAKDLGLGKYSNLGADALRGAVAGAGTQGDNRLLGGVIGGVGEGLFSALSKKKALENLIKGKEEALTPAKEIYQEIESALGKAGKAGDFKNPNIDWEALQKIPHAEFKGLMPIKKMKELSESGNYKSLEKAQSEIGKWKRALQGKGAAGADITKELLMVENAEKRIHGRLYERFMETNPELANKYEKANKLYAAALDKFDFQPFKEYESVIKKYGKADKKLREETLESLLEDPNFRMGLGQEYPEAFTSSWNPLTDYLGKIVSKGFKGK